MRRAVCLCVLSVCLLGTGPASVGQESPAEAKPEESEDLVDQLLKLPAPAPDWREQARARREKSEKTILAGQDALAQEKVPVEKLLVSWAARLSRDRFRHAQIDYDVSRDEPDADTKHPSAAAQTRLLAGCRQYPQYLPKLLNGIPETSQSYDTVYSILQDPRNADLYTTYERDRVRTWLMVRSKYFRDDLVKLAEGFRYSGKWLDNWRELQILAKLDWEDAKPIIEKHSRSEEIHAKTFALSAEYDHAVEIGDRGSQDLLRKRLKAIVTEDETPGSARARACETLLAHDWDGRDEWFLLLLSSFPLAGDSDEDPFSEHSTVYAPLENFVATHPDEWIGVLTKLVGGENTMIHYNAVCCLARILRGDARADALMPLLPWLSNPEWAVGRHGDGRLRLIRSLAEISIPESVPGLLRVAEQENRYYLAGAAEALAEHGATDAVPVLKKSLERIGEHRRGDVIAAIHKLGGFSDEEIADAVLAFATEVSTPAGKRKVDDSRHSYQPEDSIAPQLSVGQFMSWRAQATDGLAEELLKRADSLQESNPAAAEELRRIVEAWPVRTSGLQVLKRIINATATSKTVLSALRNRETLREQVGQELSRALDHEGGPKGIVAVMLGDTDILNGILDGEDGEAQKMLLASARLVRRALPVDKVAAFLDKGDEQLARAAEIYLKSEDSAEARHIILERHPNELLILGAYESFDPEQHRYFGFSGSLEGLLRDALRRDDPPDEIYALFSVDGGPNCKQRIVYVKDGKGLLRVLQGNDRYSERPLSKEDIDEIVSFVEDNRIDDLPPFNVPAYGGTQYEYVHMDRRGGRRVFMNNPHHAPSEADVYPSLTKFFSKLEDASFMTVHYGIEEKVKGLDILLADKHNRVKCVWKKGDDLRVLAFNRAAKSLAWYWVADGNLGERTDQPEECPVIGARDDIPRHFQAAEHLNPHPWEATAGEYVIRCGYFEIKSRGLWKCRKGEEPARILEGAYAHPLVTPDAKWLVAAKARGHWAAPNIVVRYDLTSGKEYTLEIPPADTFNPVAYVPAHNRFLLRRLKAPEAYHYGSESAGPKLPEYWLLDPATGESVIVKGVFWPWFQPTYRPLQSAEKENLVWAARNDYRKNRTEVGLYDTEHFRFERRMVVPSLQFDSMDMWVDQEENQLYVAVNGDLLRIPMPDN